MVAREEDETPIIDLFLQFCSRCQLQNVPNVRVEHVEKHVVLVSIQLHWSQLFSETGEKLNNVIVIIQQMKCIPDGLVCKILMWHVKVDVLWPARRVSPGSAKGRVQVHLNMNKYT